MANVLPEGGFEEDPTGWTIQDNAEVIDTAEARTGARAGHLTSRSGFSPLQGLLTSPNATLVASQVYDWTFWIKRTTSAVSLHSCRLQVDDGGGGFVTVRDVLATELSDDTWTQFTGVFTAAGTVGRARLQALGNGSLSIGTVEWYADDIEFDDGTVVDEVAIKLAERAVDAVVGTLQSNLGAEITSVNTDRGDDPQLTTPANGDYYKYPRTEVTNTQQACRIEVFERSFDVENPYSDIDTQRVAAEVPVVVRFTVFNVNHWTAEEMMQANRRYSAAVYTALVKNSNPTDDEARLLTSRRVIPFWELEDESDPKAYKVGFEMEVQVDIEEVAG